VAGSADFPDVNTITANQAPTAADDVYLLAAGGILDVARARAPTARSHRNRPR
jgi:hypothetical protein